MATLCTLVTIAFFSCLYLPVPSYAVGDGSDEERLMYELENVTHPLIRPVQFANQTVRASIFFMVRDFYVDEKTETFGAFIWNYQYWKDRNVHWEREEYSDIAYVTMPSDKIWKPNIQLMNSRKDSVSHAKRLFLGKTGWVWYMNMALFTVPCSLDLSYFPFDTQRCYMNFTSTLYNNKEVYFRPSRYVYRWWQLNRPHNHWTIVDSRITRILVESHNPKEKGSGATNTIAQLEFVLQRIPSYFTYIYITPMVVLSLLTIVMFLVPPGNKQKTTLGSSLLVCFTIFFLEINVFMPPFHANVPTLNKYYMAMFTLLAISLMFAAVTCNLTMRSEGICQPPETFKQIVIEYLGKAVFLPYNPIEYRRKVEAGFSNVNLEAVTGSTATTTATSANSATSSKPQKPEVISDWLHIAAIFDRVLFVCYLVITTIVTVTLLKRRP